MLVLRKHLLPLLLLTALTACDQKPSREQQIVASLPLQEAYDHNIERMAKLLAMTHRQVPEEQIREVLRKHLTVEDQRQDLYRLYSEKNFNDQEFALIIEATRDPAKAKALEDTDEGKRLGEKLTGLMRESANDPKVQAIVEQRMREVNIELENMEQPR
ncbi:hypothetical protein KSS94_14815 [Pseudomonas fakonensis]|uniref:DUF4142 domain-containing protein n=1 Tax=Pseudomonas fakonensis TaxID=2842355 RepID=A0ABX8MZP2_9PSED|nr:hypothetical protein [Pseudomonas fakonensis]QXH49225.1 hypothetical protein KSS94_14815 [Pseudomonas fakonensis]